MDGGGFAALFSLYPLVLPTGRRFLARVSALSPGAGSGTVTHLGHYHAAKALIQAFKAVAQQQPVKVLQTMVVESRKSLTGDRLGS